MSKPQWLLNYEAGKVKRDRRIPLAHLSAPSATELMKDADRILIVMRDKAFEGDTAAAALVLNRTIPTVRPQQAKVNFVLDATASIAQQVEQVIQAIADGNLAPDVGKKIMEAVEVLSKIRTAEDLDRRLTLLEGKVLS